MNKADIIQLAVLALDIEKVYTEAKCGDHKHSLKAFDLNKQLVSIVQKIRKIKNKNLDKDGVLPYNECSVKR